MDYTLSKEKYKLRKEEVARIISAKELKGLRSRIGLALDLSGSMYQLYNNDTVQSVVERILPIAAEFDDDAQLDMWFFAENVFRNIPANEENFLTYIKDYVLNNSSVSRATGNGTAYSPVLKDVKENYITEEPLSYPSYLIFITDGENSDQSQTEKLIHQLSYTPVFIQFVGIGEEKFSFLQKLDDLKGRYADNADFFALNDLTAISDSELYNRLLQEYPHWWQDVQNKNIFDTNTHKKGENNSWFKRLF